MSIELKIKKILKDVEGEITLKWIKPILKEEMVPSFPKEFPSHKEELRKEIEPYGFDVGECCDAFKMLKRRKHFASIEMRSKDYTLTIEDCNNCPYDNPLGGEEWEDKDFE